GLKWMSLGDIENNVHAVEVASDPGSALVERVTNAIDAVLDLEAVRRTDTAPSPHAAAQKWLGVPTGGLSEMPQPSRQKLADRVRITNFHSGIAQRPTLVVQDSGSGQHPDDFKSTLLSLMKSNKKSKTHQMGVYNAGSAATYNFSPATI